MTAISDETLMALADGELDAAGAETLRLAIAQDEALARRYADFLETRALLAAASRATDDDRVPERLLAAARRLGEGLAGGNPTVGAGIRQPPVIIARGEAAAPEFAPRNDNRKDVQRRTWLDWHMAAAASVALLIGGLAGAIGPSLMAPPVSGPAADADLAVSTSPAIAAQLSRLATGETGTLAPPGAASATEITLVSTHRMDGGGICREFLLKRGTAGASRQMRVACLADKAWQTRLVLSLPATEGFAPASASETADHFLEAAGSRGVLTGDAERQALER